MPVTAGCQSGDNAGIPCLARDLNKNLPDDKTLIRMIRTILLITLMSVTLLASGQNKKERNTDRDFPTFLLGPDAGGSIILTHSEEAGLKSHFQYRFGAFMHIRPVHSLGLATGFKYNRIVNLADYYELPLMVHFYGKGNGAFFLGPNLIYEANGSQTDFSTPELGFTLGAGSQRGGIYLSYHPAYDALIEQNTNFFLSLGIYVQLGLIRF